VDIVTIQQAVGRHFVVAWSAPRKLWHPKHPAD
jgi:hypothetical protein